MPFLIPVAQLRYLNGTNSIFRGPSITRQWHGLGEPAGVTGWGGHGSGCGSRCWTPVTREHPSLRSTCQPLTTTSRRLSTEPQRNRRKRGTEQAYKVRLLYFILFQLLLTCATGVSRKHRTPPLHAEHENAPSLVCFHVQRLP